MNNIDKARLLIRVAQMQPEGVDRKALLAWADEILADSPQHMTNRSTKQLTFPILIFRRYKGTEYSAELLEGWRVKLQGNVYSRPSAAAGHISGHQENGWRMWRYIDESTNKEQPIDNLRNP